MVQLGEAFRYKPEGRGFNSRWRHWNPEYKEWVKVIGIFHRNNPSGHTMVLGLTQPLREMSTRRPMRMGDNVTTFCADFLEILGASTS